MGRSSRSQAVFNYIRTQTETGGDWRVPLGENASVLLGGAAGATVFELLNSAGTQVFSVTDTGVMTAAGGFFMADDDTLGFGNVVATPDVTLNWETADADAHYFNIAISSVSRNIIISEDRNIDWGRAAQTNPTLYIQSSNSVETAQFISFTHNQVDAVISSGEGDIRLAPSTNLVNVQDNVAYSCGTDDDVRWQWETADADAHYFGIVISGTSSQNIIISSDNDIDWTKAAQTNPTVWIQSADSANVAQYISFSHNQTNALITSGAGAVVIDGPDGVDLLDGTVLALSVSSDGTTATLNPAAGDHLYLTTGTSGEIQLNSAGVGGVVRIQVNGADEIAVSATNVDITGNSLEMNNFIQWDTGVAVTAAQYQVTRDADGTNQLHFNVPTGASFEWSINDGPELFLNATELTPGANGGTALGTGTVSWNGLFLLAGTSINWGNGNVILSLSGANSSQLEWQGVETFTWTEVAQASGTPTFLTFTEAAHTGITAATEDIGVNFNLSATKTWAAGAGPLGIQREFVIQAPTYAGNAGGALTMSLATTLNVGGPPIAGANMTITTPLIARFGADTASGVTSTVAISHLQDAAGSSSRLWAVVAGASGGDAYIQQTVVGVSDWTFGLDNSDSDAWVLANSTALGTTNALRVTSQQLNLGSAGDFTINSADTSESTIVIQNQAITRATAGSAVSITPSFGSDVTCAGLTINPTITVGQTAGRHLSALSVWATTSGAITSRDVIGLRVFANDISGTGTAERSIGLRIANMEDAQATNPYGIAIESQGGDNNNKALWLEGTGSANAIQLGNSPMIYSSAANTIRLDDSTAARGIVCTMTFNDVQTIGTSAGDLVLSPNAAHVQTAANVDINLTNGSRVYGGGVQINNQTLAANTNLTMDENDGNVDITTGAVSDNTITLPAASGNQGMIVSFYLEVDGGNNAVITRAGADVIQNGAADLANTTVTLDTAGEYLMLQCVSASMWQVVVNVGGVVA